MRKCLVHKHAYECVSMLKMCRCHGTRHENKTVGTQNVEMAVRKLLNLQKSMKSS